MKKLIISANPSTKGFTHKIVKKINDLSLEQGHEVKILDLYQTNVMQGYLTYEEKREIGRSAKVKEMQAIINWADEIVFVFPIWWGDMPAIMKNYWDCNFVPGYAYKYMKGGKKVGLLTGKRVRVVATSGSSAFVFKYIIPLPFIWRISRVGFCGMKLKSFTIFGNMDRSKTDRDKYLEKIYKVI